ncbi:adenine deaminase C-terminal domain-containing protein [Salirhabdus salicampi]|uniref:adenine deaminase C-terminal domain-containing protein n=1 Tax=Salirhabdus salicampi TaxID=476102 RepID=UPI0020C3B6EF|nr:adenine deaminase C-terminal domain-containing protein [Salirhabdus salicampi]MCP8617849.1 amidohydrolase family protein [Salirhabdus salicampi]
MSEHRYKWRNRQLREHVAVIDGKLAPSIVLKDATYLNVYLKRWMSGHIWIYDDRIVYVGDQLPSMLEGTEIVNCESLYLVPGYIEPHAHPFQLYNPHNLSEYAAKTGTTVFINDNLPLLFLMDKKKAFSLIDRFHQLPSSLYWWSRFDSQSALQDEESFIKNANILSWLKHDAVLQGGELTSWPSVLKDDDRMLHWMQEAKRLKKPVEGHFPGSSTETLTKMKLLGADGDHEAITGEEVYRRLILGYYVALRNSSIRPDLRRLFQELKSFQITEFDQMMLTTDGATPSFYKEGVMNKCIEIAIDEGVRPEEAYRMGSYNAAKYFGIDHHTGSIGPGRLAHINFLEALDNPTPVRVLAKGNWVDQTSQKTKVNWHEYGIQPLQIDWSLNDSDFRFYVPVGLEMVNDVIMKPFTIKAKYENELNKLDDGDNLSFLIMLDQKGSWRISTLLKGFTKSLGGLVSSYSNTGDIILTGVRKSDMNLAFERMKEIGGGIVLANEGDIIFELPLTLSGMMYDGNMETLMEKEARLTKLLKQYGYAFDDPIYTILFLSAIHLPYIRITPQGIIDVKKKEVLFPSIMR